MNCSFWFWFVAGSSLIECRGIERAFDPPDVCAHELNNRESAKREFAR
jgi:hypothetical protein